MKKTYSACLIFLLFFLGNTRADAGSPLKEVKAAICVQSNFSDGRYSLEQVVQIARENGIRIVIMGDDALRRWEYGIRPLEYLIKRRVEQDSVLRQGVEKYLKRIKQVNSSCADVLIIEGVEAAPFYWWGGSVFKKNLSLSGWHRELLVVGLNHPDDYRQLPMVSNNGIIPRNLNDLRKITWPLLIIFLGILLIVKRFTRQLNFKGREFILLSVSHKKLGFFLFSAGVIFLLNNWHFPFARFNQFDGDKGLRPYQEFIDYVRQRNGLCFWLHLGGYNVTSVGKIAFYTYRPESILKNTYGYSGFSGIQAGEVSPAVMPGQAWDQLLLSYCQGEREYPAWVIGESGFQEGNKMDTTQTILRLKEISRAAALDALKNGRMYLKSEDNSNSLSLDDFSLRESVSGNTGFIGDELVAEKGLFIHLKIGLRAQDNLKIDLIRNGALLRSFEAEGPAFEIEIEDMPPETRQKNYYRLYVESASGSKIITNPIFVSKRP